MVFSDGTEFVLQHDGIDTKEIANKQIEEIGKYCSNVKT